MGQEEEGGEAENTPTPITEDRVVELIREAVSGIKVPEVNLDEVVAKVSEAVKPKVQEDPPKKKPEEDPRFLELQGKLEEMERKARASEEAARQERLVGTVKQALLDGRAAPERVSVAVNHLVSSGSVKYDEDGRLVYVGTNSYGQEVHKPVSEGVSEFLSTDTGKMFLPPRSVKGTGSGAGQGDGVGGGGTANPEAITRSALSRLMTASFTDE